ncbi:GNAT family N-acetyltransferase [Mesobacillus selenatarsenatis]|uniref:Acetyltransferase, GNAT family n=1 Tax=Mesobacillus selenatarsenatis (strain DSM 18680 / JCM 14380 / FERM P-15431 / SF-1) TaxID=1321606 RepID=A0A0A8X3L9_MESS1|nr:GNAT family N-acetyltransferase [Mesobacillus selenatarsenatis]GAM14575.1 acetyltransferase, GNAT family [Mesobacillus selenatarsenatis SF-1]
MKVTLEKIRPDKKEVLRNLYSLYLHDLSAYTDGLQISKDGSFEFDSFSLIWEKEGITPYFIKVDEKLAGFVLILEAPFTKKVDKVINDFFVLNAFRGKGVSKAAVSEIFAHNKGRYYISQLVKNETAVHFWKNIYKQMEIDFVEQPEVQDGEEVVYQTFTVIKMPGIALERERR